MPETVHDVIQFQTVSTTDTDVSDFDTCTRITDAFLSMQTLPPHSPLVVFGADTDVRP